MALTTSIPAATSDILSGPLPAPLPKRRIVRALLRDRTAALGLVIVFGLCLAAVLAPWISPHDPNAVDVAQRFRSPSRQFLLGTDHLGRDTLSRLLYGARLSILSTFVATTAISCIAIAVGLVSGYFGGPVDALVSRVVDVALTVPSLLLALAICAALGSGLPNVVIAIIVVSWAGYSRIVRGAVIAVAMNLLVDLAYGWLDPRIRYR